MKKFSLQSIEIVGIWEKSHNCRFAKINSREMLKNPILKNQKFRGNQSLWKLINLMYIPYYLGCLHIMKSLPSQPTPFLRLIFHMQFTCFFIKTLDHNLFASLKLSYLFDAIFFYKKLFSLCYLKLFLFLSF